MRYMIATIVLLLFFLFVSGFSEGQTSTTTPVANLTQPARIELKAEVSHIMANDYETVKLTAFVYDAQGHPISDGTQVNFTIGNAASNTYTGGFVWSIDNGSFSAPPGSGTFTNVTRGGMGSTNAQFGRVPRGLGGNNSTIWAYINGTNIYSTVKIYFANPMASWTGQVVDSSGDVCGGIPVTLHVMGVDSNQTPYEIYNMTRTTGISQPFVGQFTFDYIVISNVAYGYADVEALSANNQTIYGKSDNFSMTRSDTSIGVIVLQTPIPTLIPSPTPTRIPSVTPMADNGMASELAIAIIVIIMGAGGAYYLFKKK